MSSAPFAVLAAWALIAATATVARRPAEAVAADGRQRPWSRRRTTTGSIAHGLEVVAAWRAGRRAEVGLPEAVDAVAAAVGAGRSMVDGFAVAAGASPPALAAELHEVLDATALGFPLHVALERWADRSEVEGAPLVAAAIGLAGDAGGDVELALAGVAATLRERRALGREIRALSSQARASAATIAIAPIGFGGLAALADGETAAFLFGSPAGLACLAVGLLLDLAGFRWMRRLAARVR